MANSALNPIVAKLNQINGLGNRTEVDSFAFSDLLPMEFDKYFRYQGSLTTPGCDEFVDWIVVDNPVIEISERQLLKFQSILNENGFPVNFKILFMLKLLLIIKFYIIDIDELAADSGYQSTTH